MKIGIFGDSASASQVNDHCGQIEEIEVVAVSDAASSVISAHDVEAVIVTGSGHATRDIYESAATFGKHLLVMQPGFTTEAELVSAVQNFSGKANRVMLGNELRFTPLYETLERVISAGDLGQIGIARLLTSRSSDDSSTFPGGALESITQEVDLLQWYFGPARRIYAKSIKGADDYIQAVIRFESGEIAYVENSLRHTRFRREIELAGSDGHIRQASDETISLVVDTYESADTAVMSERSNPFEEHPGETMIQNFVDGILTNTPFLIEIDDARRSMQIIDAIDTSIRTGEVVILSA